MLGNLADDVSEKPGVGRGRWSEYRVALRCRLRCVSGARMGWAWSC